MALILCHKHYTNKAIEAYKYLCNYIGKDIAMKRMHRKEYHFNEIIENLFNKYKIIPQFQVMNYRIDWYIPELKLAIEYDEKYHENQIEEVDT